MSSTTTTDAAGRRPPRADAPHASTRTGCRPLGGRQTGGVAHLPAHRSDAGRGPHPADLRGAARRAGRRGRRRAGRARARVEGTATSTTSAGAGRSTPTARPTAVPSRRARGRRGRGGPAPCRPSSAGDRAVVGRRGDDGPRGQRRPARVEDRSGTPGTTRNQRHRSRRSGAGGRGRRSGVEQRGNMRPAWPTSPGAALGRRESVDTAVPRRACGQPVASATRGRRARRPRSRPVGWGLPVVRAAHCSQTNSPRRTQRRAGARDRQRARRALQVADPLRVATRTVGAGLVDVRVLRGGVIADARQLRDSTQATSLTTAPRGHLLQRVDAHLPGRARDRPRRTSAAGHRRWTRGRRRCANLGTQPQCQRSDGRAADRGQGRSSLTSARLGRSRGRPPG